MAWGTDRPFGSKPAGTPQGLDQGQATPLTPIPSQPETRSLTGPLRWFGALALLLAACGGSSSSDPSNSPQQPVETAKPADSPAALAPAPAAPKPPAAPVPRDPDGQRILEDVRHLAEDIGPRPAASAAEKRAADFLAGRLRGLGYDVTLQEFAASSEASRTSTLATSGRVIASAPFEGSGAGSITAPLVIAGIGRPGEFPAATKGAIALIERGELLFDQKVRNAQAAGARGAIIYNSGTGLFYASLSFEANLPVIAISRAEGLRLAADLQREAIEVEIGVTELGKGVSRNVVAKPPGRECTTVSGGHYDSVTVAPGANDNASGTATVLEMAAVIASKGDLGSHCFVLFGAEEPGLIGSRAYVASLDTAARQRIKAMLNFDMTGFGDRGWIFIGSSELQKRALEQALALGIPDSRGGGLPRNSSSDHASFLSAGIPALFYYRSEDAVLHTPQDTAGRLSPLYLEQAARLGVAMLESLSAG